MSHASFIYLDDGISGNNSRTDASAATILAKSCGTINIFFALETPPPLPPIQS